MLDYYRGSLWGIPWVIQEKKIINLPEKYILNENACICFWEDGTKTISKRHEDDTFDKEVGFLFACWQKYNEDKSRNLRKKILSCIKPECMKDFLFEKFRGENEMTVEQARRYLRDLKIEDNKKTQWLKAKKEEANEQREEN
jgi:hypothetical protein